MDMDIVIAGGGYAGIACATRLARQAPVGARIRLINPQPVLTERIRLHQAVAGQPLKERRIDTLLAACGVELVTGRVEAIDPGGQTLRVSGQELRWNRLVLAMGSRAAAPDAPPHALTLDAQRPQELQRRLRALARGARVLVVGGGLTGIETASELAEAYPHLRLELVTLGLVGGEFSAAGRQHILHTLERLHVTVREHAETAMDADLCIWAAGFEFPALPRAAGVAVNARGQVLVDSMLCCVSHPAIHACGDIAARQSDEAVPLGCKSAMPMGAQVGENLARELRGQAPEAFDYDLLFYCVSLGRRDGLIQWPDADGRPMGRILTGRRAALFKEVICRSTWWALRLEAKGRRGVVWKRTGRALRELADAGQARA